MHVAGMMGLPQAPRPVPEFLYHLTRMLREPSSHRLIEWDAGRILVHDPVRLESEVLIYKDHQIEEAKAFVQDISSIVNELITLAEPAGSPKPAKKPRAISGI